MKYIELFDNFRISKIGDEYLLLEQKILSKSQKTKNIKEKWDEVGEFFYSPSISYLFFKIFYLKLSENIGTNINEFNENINFLKLQILQKIPLIDKLDNGAPKTKRGRKPNEFKN